MSKAAQKGLTKTQLKRFHKLLHDKEAEIRENLRSSKATMALARGEEPANMEDLPVQSHEEWIFLNRNNIDVMLLREIQGAMQRIGNAGYGTCLNCDEEISIKRLNAIPWALYCVPCQEEAASSDGSLTLATYSKK